MAFVDFKSALRNSDLGKCRGISTARRKSSRYLTRRHAKAGLQLEEVMMARTRIIQSYTQVNFALSAANQQICSCPAAAASRRRGNDLGRTIKYLRKTVRGAAGIGLGTTIKSSRAAADIPTMPPNRNTARQSKSNTINFVCKALSGQKNAPPPNFALKAASYKGR